MRLTVELLGKPRFWADDTDVTAKLPVKAQALLVYLILNRDPQTRISLAGLLWGETTEDKAKNSLRVILAAIRKLLPDFLEVTHTTIAFNFDADYRLDTERFVVLLTGGGWLDMAQLYRGDFTSDLFIEGAPQFEEWQLTQRAYWRDAALAGLSQGGEALLAERAYVAAQVLFQKSLQLEPWQEEIHQRLMMTYARLGDFNRAMTQYKSCQTLLLEEFDVPPMPETIDLYERIRSARQNRPTLLPPGDLPFVGRTRELAEVGEHLLNPDRRLITIIGLGGSGKTRLAIEAARQAEREQALEFINGMLFVSLANEPDPRKLPALIIEAAGLSGLSNTGTDMAALLSFLSNKEMLIILDNFEDLVDGEAALTEIINRAPGVTLLVTSRNGIELGSAWRVDLSGLAYPDGEDDAADIDEYPAVQLFLEAGQQVRPGFALAAENRSAIERLCALVDGNPLALRLSAAWLKVTDIDQIVETIAGNLDMLSTTMRSLPERQRSLRAVLDYSWAGLSEKERTILGRLLLFTSGFTLEAARSVADADLMVLSQLVDHSLLHFRAAEGEDEVGWYALHALVRQYLIETDHSDGQKRGQSWARYKRFYADFLAAQYAAFLNGRYHAVIARLRPELPNLSVCWTGLLAELGEAQPAAEQDAVVLLTEMVQPLAWFYRRVGRYIEGVALFDQAVAVLAEMDRDDRHTLLLAQMEIRLGLLRYYIGDYRRCEALVDQALPVLRAADLKEEEGLALLVLTLPLRRRGEYEQTRVLATEAQTLFRSIGDRHGEMRALNALAVTAADEGDYARAEALGRQVSTYYAGLNDMPNFVRASSNLANTLMRAGRQAEAKPLLAEAYELARADKNYFSIVISATNLGNIAIAEGELEQAELYLRQSLETSREIGNKRWESVNLSGLAKVALARSRWSRAERRAVQGLEIAHEIQSEQDMLTCLLLLGEIWLARGELERGGRILLEVQRQPALVVEDRDKSEALLARLEGRVDVEQIKEEAQIQLGGVVDAAIRSVRV